MVTALITGAAGQDGLILSAMISREGGSVTALVKPGSDCSLLHRYAPTATVVELDLADSAGLRALVAESRAAWVVNFGAFTAPDKSFGNEDEVRHVNVDAVDAILNGIRDSGGSTRLFQASSAAIFEGVDYYPQDEQTVPQPKSPYAQSKLEALELVREARERDGIFAVSGILYNHESPLRGPQFVTRKVTIAAARIAAGLQDRLELGNIDVARDWGWAPDVVRGIRLMLEADEPRDYILASGISHRLSFFVRRAFETVGISDWTPYVVSTSDNLRSVDTNRLVGNSRQAWLDLGWRPLMDFDDMVRAMVQHDVELIENPEALWLGF